MKNVNYYLHEQLMSHFFLWLTLFDVRLELTGDGSHFIEEVELSIVEFSRFPRERFHNEIGHFVEFWFH